VALMFKRFLAWLDRVLGEDEQRWTMVYETDRAYVLLGDVLSTREKALEYAERSTKNITSTMTLSGRCTVIPYGSTIAVRLRASKHGNIPKE